MSEFVLGKCRYCRSEVRYQDGETYVKCPSCGESLVIAEFQNEQIKIRKALAEGEKARRDLEEAERARKAEQEKTWKVISDMDGLKGSMKEQETQLKALLKEQQVDQETQKEILELMKVLKSEGEQGQNSIVSVLSQIVSGQDTAQKKLAAIQTVTAQLADEKTDMLTALNQISVWLHTDAEKRNQELSGLTTWFLTKQKQDHDQLGKLNGISTSLLSGQEKLDRNISQLRDKVDENQKAIRSFEGKWEQAKLDELVELYHQAENLQMDMSFDQAEEYYRKVIVRGGKDPEVYWRIILCHYGIAYQQDNEGNKIPSVLRPDLSTQQSIRKDLEGSFRSDQDKKYYTSELKRIDDLLEKYRLCQQTTHYDIFISLKQKIQYNGKEAYTEDYKIGNDLYRHLTQMGLRVFNSEQPDCKRPGEEWEPYILAALLSSRMMIVVGTSADYMNSQWVRNEWQRFQWLQKEEKKAGKTDRKLLCFIDNMTGYDLPRGLDPIQAIINKAGAFQELDRVVDAAFPERAKGKKKESGLEEIRNQMRNWLLFKKFDLVQEEYTRIISEGKHSLDVWVNLYNVCAEHRLSKPAGLESPDIDLEKEESIQVVLEFSDDQEAVQKLRDMIERNRENRQKTQKTETEEPQKPAAKTAARKTTQKTTKSTPSASEKPKAAANKENNATKTEQNNKTASSGQKETVKEEPARKGSFEWLHKAAMGGNAEAQKLLGDRYQTGLAVKQDYAEAYKWYRKSADQGNAAGQYCVGLCYAYGWGVQKDDAEAARWYKLSADQGNKDAQANLQEKTGSGAEKKSASGSASAAQKAQENTARKGSFEWLHKAAMEGKAEAQKLLGDRYFSGIAVKKDYTEAYKWYRKSADQGYAAGQYLVGNCYANGLGVKKDDAEAEKWYQLSAGQGYADAVEILKSKITKTADSAPESKPKTSSQSAAQKKTDAVKKDSDEARKDLDPELAELQKNAERGNPFAQYDLGCRYRDGIGVQQDYEEAVKWFRRSAEKRDMDSQCEMGVAFLYGRGVAQNNQEAIEWFKRSANQGNDVALNYLGECYEKGFGVEKNPATAYVYYNRSAMKGNPAAQYHLGYFYENGISVKQDYVEAVKMYQQSANQGYQLSSESLVRLKTQKRALMNSISSIKMPKMSVAGDRSSRSKADEYVRKSNGQHTVQDKTRFWRENLPSVFRTVLTGADLNDKVVRNAMKRMGVTPGDDEVIALIEAKKGSFMGFVTVMITTRQLFVDVNEKSIYTTIAADFSSIKSATAVPMNTAPRKCTFNVILKSGNQRVIAETQKPLSDTINYKALANAVNAYISKFED